MNKFRGIIAPEQISTGDIIQYETQGSMMERRRSPYSYGYVQAIEYAAQQADAVVAVRVLPVVKAGDAEGSDFRYRRINPEGAGKSFGLDPNQQWAVLFAPVTLHAQMDHFGRKDGMVQRMGSILETSEERDLLEQIENFGGDERLSRERHGGPREARPHTSTWGLYIPLGIRKDRFADDELVDDPRRRVRAKKKHDFEGLVLDIDLDVAVGALGLDKGVAAMLSEPAGAGVKKITGLRAAHAMVSADEKALARYVRPSAPQEDIPLKHLMGSEIHVGVVNGLAEPRKGTDVAPITTLKEAFTLVTERPGDIAKYMFMGPVLSKTAVADVTKAYDAHLRQPPTAAEAASAVKAAWRALMTGYMAFKDTDAVPESLRNADGSPVWKMVPKAP